MYNSEMEMTLTHGQYILYKLYPQCSFALFCRGLDIGCLLIAVAHFTDMDQL